MNEMQIGLEIKGEEVRLQELFGRFKNLLLF